MAATLPTDARIPFELGTGEQRAGQSKNSKTCTIVSAFVLGMMVATIGLLTVQHYGLGDASLSKFFFAPAGPRVQPVPSAARSPMRGHVSNKIALNSDDPGVHKSTKPDVHSKLNVNGEPLRGEGGGAAVHMPAPLSRADLLKSSAALAVVGALQPALALDDDDDDDLGSKDDQVPMVGSMTGRKKPKKPSEMQKTKADPEAGKSAFASIVKARDALKRGDMNAPELKELSNSLSTLVQSPVLSASDKKTIGSSRTYGLAADAMIMLGGGEPNKAIQVLDEIVVTCESSGLKP